MSQVRSPGWVRNSIFYHIYPLGMCGAPAENDPAMAASPRLEMLHEWLPYLTDLGINAIYIGPLFESSSHGYDTIDYRLVDRRLGTNATLKQLIQAIHANGMRVILDTVFNHTGRDFQAFKDIQANAETSAYRDWYSGLTFNQSNPSGDPFSYDTWDGHTSLPKLNLRHAAVCAHLLEAVSFWISEFEIDGLRLDAADVLDLDFLRMLRGHCKRLKPDFWLLGEVVYDDYRKWANADALDSVTNYEAYKGLYSSLNDHNYFEIAYALNRQFGAQGIYRHLQLYNFADNHDVHRAASILDDPNQHLLPLYLLLFTMPGVPSIYYGSEWALGGKRSDFDDDALRPALLKSPSEYSQQNPDLLAAISQLAKIRKSSSALQAGNYTELHVAHEQLAFSRATDNELVIVALNASKQSVTLDIQINDREGMLFQDMLARDQMFRVSNGNIHFETLPPGWGRILKQT